MFYHSSLLTVPEFSFDSGSAVRYQLGGGGSSRHTHIQLRLRTRASSGTLLSVMSREANEYIILKIADGHLFCPVQPCGSRSASVAMTTCPLPLEQGGGSREVQARLGSRREIVVHPASVMVGNVSKSGEKTTFKS
ncbi:LOW QUALITY PROTEIN: neural-cadherin-like [Xyrichtys novacula]|uniref:LOW QUALITY PROTEIN: neural-cadherin-like n=1 Tax=Xyrichtys novacula TaxID=13765 RepID=A0AAV1F4D3_XYRNO|nr:LOW QUALITY PROTEIN: neural-cadherin-like [Xyrichtys novacula]